MANKIPRLRTGDIVLVGVNKRHPLSILISKITKCKYTHAAIVYKAEEDRVLLLDIDNSSSKIIPLSRFKGRDICIKRMTSFDYTKHGSAMRTVMLYKYFDRSYDFKQLFSMGFRLLFGFEKVINSEEKLVCSEMVYIIYKDLGYHLVDNSRPAIVTPKDIYECDTTEVIYREDKFEFEFSTDKILEKKMRDIGL